jgi:uncharacterized protein (DUF488 family)
MSTILTIGHSRHSLERFVALLEGAGATAVADIRSAPVSRFSPHFNKTGLAASLAAQDIAYFFLGRELGGRPEQPEMYTKGRADYERMVASPQFQEGLGRLTEEAAQHQVAAMCSEADPLDCHRCLLVGRALAASGHDVGHILGSGEIIPHAETEERLLQLENLTEAGLLLRSRDQRLAEAYRLRCRKIAYARPAASSAPRGGRERQD